MGVGHRAREPQSGAYHLVWSRDLYQIATGADRGRRPRRRRARARLPVRRAAEARRLVPAELDVAGAPHWDDTAARRGRLPDRARLAARRDDAQTSRARQAGGRLPRRDTGPRTDRSAGRTRPAGRRPPSPPRSPASSAPPTSPARNGDDAQRGALRATADAWQAASRLDGDHQRPVLRRAVLPARDQGRQPERGTTYAIGDSGPERVDQRRSSTRASSSSCGSASSRRRPDDPQHDRGRRPAARGRHAERPLLAPLQLRRLRRDSSTASRGTRSRTRQPAPRSAAPGRSSPASAASTSWPPAARRSAPAAPRWPAPPTTAA